MMKRVVAVAIAIGASGARGARSCAQACLRKAVEGLEQETIYRLGALLVVADEQGRTPLAWLREWPEAPHQKNLAGLVERLHTVRKLGVEPDRETRIHRARYAAIAKEIAAILVPRDVSRFDTHRRLTTLVVFAREMEAVLTDAAITIFDKMLGSVFRRADNRHKKHLVARAKTLDASTRALLGMAEAMLAAKGKGEDQIAAVERALGQERLTTLVDEADKTVATTCSDNLGEIVERHSTVRHISVVLLAAFTFRSLKSNDPLLAALDVLRRLHAIGAKKNPAASADGLSEV